MSTPQLVGLLVGLILIGVAVYFAVKQYNKYNELQSLVKKFTNELGVLRDSQQGLGMHVLELERQLHGLLVLQSAADQPVADGVLNQIAARLRAGAGSAEIIAALGVSEAEVKLVQVIVQNSDTQPSPARSDPQTPV